MDVRRTGRAGPFGPGLIEYAGAVGLMYEQEKIQLAFLPVVRKIQVQMTGQ